MRHRLTITLSVVVVLLLATVVAGYQRVSALTCTTAAFAEWDAHGEHGTGACLLYLALAPDGDRVEETRPRPRSSPARPDPTATTGAAAPAPQTTAVVSTPSPAPTTPPAPPAPAPPQPEPEPEPTGADPYSTFEEADFGSHTITCLGKAFRFWQEVARFYGEDPSCRAWSVAVGLDADGEVTPGDPTFHSSGETQQYFLLQEEDAAALA